MKLELTAKEVKSIGQKRAMVAIDKKFLPWVCLGVITALIGLFIAISTNTIGVLFLAIGVILVLVLFFIELQQAQDEGYKFLDSVIKGDTEKEQ